MQPVPIDTCFNPVRVPRGDGFIYVPCGSCPACHKSFHSKWRNRLDHAIKSHASTLFITLTYSNEHLPLCEIDPTTNDIISVTHTKFKRGTSCKYERVDITDSFLNQDVTFPYIFNDLDINELPHFVVSRLDNHVVFDTESRFAVCLRKDIQDFLKRLRIILSRNSSLADYDTSFTYFICSEYGPETFRPHYHGLLFFNDPYIASLCQSCYVHESWRKSNLSSDALEKECQFVSFGKGASSYSSKYVTCDDVLPSFLSNKFFKQFHVSSHSEPIGSTCLPFSAVSHTVRETDLLYNEVIKDKDTGEFITVRLPYPSSFWSRYFPKFLFHGNLSLSILSQLYARIFSLPLHKSPPNRIKEFNSLFCIGEIRHTSPIEYGLRHKEITYYWSALGALRPWDLFPVGRGNNDIIYRVTYTDALPHLLSHPDFIDLFLFGIPQNRTVVNKILKLRLAALNSDDNWCYSYKDYMEHFYLYMTKTFTNSLSKFYDNFTTNFPSTSFTPETIQQYYPSFYNSLPKELSAFNQSDFFKVEDILFYNFGLSVESLYDDDGNLLTFDYYNSPLYSYHRFMVSAYFRSFVTKRKANYAKYGCGEAPPT